MSSPQPSEKSSTMGTHDSSDPPAVPSQADETGKWIVEKAKKARDEAREALDTSRDTRSEVSKLVEIVGVSPNQALGTPGSGLLGAFSLLSSKVDKLSESQEKLVKALSSIMAIIKVGGAAIVAAMAISAYQWFSGLHH